MVELLQNASVEAARAHMLALTKPLQTQERVALDAARTRILAADIVANRDQPPFIASAMDGYALRAADAPGRLNMIGEAAAGSGLTQALQPGQAARIFTGAPLPDGADCVIIQEDVTRDGDAVTVPAAQRFQNTRDRGIDFKLGDTLLRAGTKLDGIALALAAARGAAELSVRKRPRIALLATGDEIVPPGAPIGPHQIYESVSFGLKGLIEAWGGDAWRLAPRGDDIEALAAAAREGLAHADLLVTIGGASVGDRDLVKPALKQLGLALAVERITVRPGKPTWFGQTQHGPVLGLPGNPASALVCGYLFLRPITAKLLNVEPAPRFTPARLATALPANGPREHYVRAKLGIDAEGRQTATPFEQQDSSLLSIFRDSDALVRLPISAPAMPQGALVDVLTLNRD